MNVFRGRIVEIQKNESRTIHLTQGIKKEEQYKYESRYTGGSGTYVTGGDYLGTTLDVKIFVYDLNRCLSFDIRDYVLRMNNKTRISSKLLNHIIEMNSGNKVDVIDENDRYTFDVSQLNVIV